MVTRIATEQLGDAAIAKIREYIEDKDNLPKIKTKLRQILGYELKDDSSEWETHLSNMEDYIFENLVFDKMDIRRFLERYLSPEQLYQYVAEYFDYLESQFRESATLIQPDNMNLLQRIAARISGNTPHARIAQRYIQAYQLTLIENLANGITGQLNANLPKEYKLTYFGKTHETTIPHVSFERRPAIFDRVSFRGSDYRLREALHFLVEYDPKLQSPAETMDEWIEMEFSPEMVGQVGEFVIEAGYFRRERGMGFDPKHKIALGTGRATITGEKFEMDVELDDPEDQAQILKEYIDNLMANPPTQALTPLRGPARQREVPAKPAAPVSPTAPVTPTPKTP
jgi:hypothetical protein